MVLIAVDHAFCAACTNRWFHNHATCPLCRLDCRFVNGFAPYTPRRAANATNAANAVADTVAADTVSNTVDNGDRAAAEQMRAEEAESQCALLTVQVSSLESAKFQLQATLDAIHSDLAHELSHELHTLSSPP